MKEIEKKILNIIQHGFPLEKDPDAEIGRQAECGAEQAYETVQALRDKGVIRRIGGTFSADSLGCKSTLVAAKVKPELIEEVADFANGFEQITHNYRRNHEFNLWFTIIAESEKKILDIVDSVAKRDGVKDIHSLPATHNFKLKVDFYFKEKNK